MNVSDHFECPKCGDDRIEEVLTDVCASSEVTDFEDGAIDYGNTSTEGGTIDRFQCMECGWKLPVESVEELCKYLENPDRECKPGCFHKEEAQDGHA